MRFAASEPATNKALQEVRVLGGFGLFDTTPPWPPRVPACGRWPVPWLLPAPAPLQVNP